MGGNLTSITAGLRSVSSPCPPVPPAAAFPSRVNPQVSCQAARSDARAHRWREPPRGLSEGRLQWPRRRSPGGRRRGDARVVWLADRHPGGRRHLKGLASLPCQHRCGHEKTRARRGHLEHVVALGAPAVEVNDRVPRWRRGPAASRHHAGNRNHARHPMTDHGVNRTAVDASAHLAPVWRAPVVGARVLRRRRAAVTRP